MARDDASPAEATTVPAMLTRSAALHADNEALVSASSRLTYRDLICEVHRAANAMLDAGVSAGDRVAIWLPNTTEWVVTYLAAACIGAITMPVNTRFRTEEARFVLTAADPSLIVTTDCYLTNDYLGMLRAIAPDALTASAGSIKSENLPSLRHVITLEDPSGTTLDWEVFRAGAPTEPTPGLAQHMAKVGPNDPLAIFWTSGTTSTPKGAVVPHRVVENVAHYAGILDYNSADRCLASAPLFYTTTNYWVLLVSLQCGGSCVMQKRLTTDETLELLGGERVTVMVGMPNMFMSILKHPEFDGTNRDALRCMWLGGANVSTQLVDELVERMAPERICQVYGTTETGGITTMTPPSLDASVIAPTVGRPMPNFELRIVDPAGDDVVDGGVGELWVRSPYNLLTYSSAGEDLLAEAFAEDGWFRTGDRFSRDAFGNFSFRGRIKDMIKVGGENVAAREVEEVLCTHDLVRQAAVVGVPDRERNEAVVAFVETVRHVSPEELHEFCRRRLAKFKRPREFVFRTDWPLTATGKIQKFQLRSEFEQAEET